MEREQLQKKWCEVDNGRAQRFNGRHGPRARSDLTGTFDWARSDLTGMVQESHDGENETTTTTAMVVVVPDNEKLHCFCQLPEAQGTVVQYNPQPYDKPPMITPFKSFPNHS